MVKIIVTKELIEAVTDRFGSVKGDSHYISWLDRNSDGIIDIADYYALALMQGQIIDIPHDPQATFQNTWTYEGHYSPYRISYLSNPPWTEADLRVAFEPKLNEALGAFAKSCLDKGLSITLKGYTLTLEDRILASWQSKDHTVEDRQVFFKFTLNYESPVPTVASPKAPVIAAAVAVAIVTLGAFVGYGIYEALKGLTSSSSEHTSNLKITNPSDQPVTIKLSDGTVATIPPGGTLDYTATEKTTTPGWETILIIFAAVAIVLIVLFYMGGRVDVTKRGVKVKGR